MHTYVNMENVGQYDIYIYIHTHTLIEGYFCTRVYDIPICLRCENFRSIARRFYIFTCLNKNAYIHTTAYAYTWS